MEKRRENERLRKSAKRRFDINFKIKAVKFDEQMAEERLRELELRKQLAELEAEKKQLFGTQASGCFKSIANHLCKLIICPSF